MLAPRSSPDHRVSAERQERRARTAEMIRNAQLDKMVNGDEYSQTLLNFEGSDEQYRRAALYFQREILRQVENHTELMEQQNRLLQDIRTSNLASAPRLEGGGSRRNQRNLKKLSRKTRNRKPKAP